MPTTTADGLQIAYSDKGSGEMPILALTGWCSSRARYDRLLPLLAARRRVLSVDWRGHGDSATPSGDFGHEQMAQDALAVIDAAGLDRFAVIASSHAGWAAIALRGLLRDRIPHIIHMDWLVFEPSQPYMDVLSQLEGQDSWQQGRDTLFRIWRGGVQDDGVEAALDVMNRHRAEMWMRSGREISGAFREQGSPLHAYAQMPAPPQVLHLYGQPHDAEYLDRQREFAEAHDWFSVRRLPAQSHFTMIETPVEAAEAIGEFLS
ncbi:MAG: alpha/beta fold hydrolase [Solirubrobacteraceae bacterium]